MNNEDVFSWAENADGRQLHDDSVANGILRKDTAEALSLDESLKSKYDRKSLIDACNRGTQFEYLFFWGHTEKGDQVSRACLSQWYPCKFVINGLEYNCAEQFMMAEKARLFGDDEVLEKIMASSEQKMIKALGRQVHGFDTNKWNRAKRNIVIRGNIAKFTQNSKLKDYLLSTGDKILVEASPYDKVWGIGMRASDKRAANPIQWNGENLLGFSLMVVRDNLLMIEKKKE